MTRAGQFRRAVTLGATIAFLAGAEAPQPLGIFQSDADVGTVLHAGAASFDPAAKSYTVTGGGENMWFAMDDFHFVWKKISDENVSVAADVSILGEGGDNHRKAVLMFRQSLDPDSIYADAALHGDGLTSLQFRDTKGAVTHEIESNVSAPKRLGIRKRGDRFYMWIGDPGGDLRFAGGSARIPMKAPFYVGIGVCAHNKDAVQRAAFSNLELSTGLAPAPISVSTLQTVAIASTDARVVLVSDERMVAPEYSPDGVSLVFQAGAMTRRIAAVGGTAEAIAAADHIPTSGEPRLSPDGRFLAVLTKSGDEMQLAVTATADHTTKPIAEFTGNENSLSAHPWSPDSKRLAYVSYQSLR